MSGSKDAQATLIGTWAKRHGNLTNDGRAALRRMAATLVAGAIRGGVMSVSDWALAHELVKADRRTAEQERIIGKLREKLHAAEGRIAAAVEELANWQLACEVVPGAAWHEKNRIAAVRKLLTMEES